MLPRNVTPVNLEVLRRLKLALVELESKAASLRCALFRAAAVHAQRAHARLVPAQCMRAPQLLEGCAGLRMHRPTSSCWVQPLSSLRLPAATAHAAVHCPSLTAGARRQTALDRAAVRARPCCRGLLEEILDDDEELAQLNLSSRPAREDRQRERERDRLKRTSDWCAALASRCPLPWGRPRHRAACLQSLPAGLAGRWTAQSRGSQACARGPQAHAGRTPACSPWQAQSRTAGLGAPVARSPAQPEPPGVRTHGSDGLTPPRGAGSARARRITRRCSGGSALPPAQRGRASTWGGLLRLCHPCRRHSK